MSFSGFTADALKFLLENKMHNSKEWYESHKDEYKKYVYTPFVELITELSPAISEIDSSLITVPSKLISRVRRDTRFAKDKSLFRDNAWFAFVRDKSLMASSPCYWFEISQKGSSYGVGYYSARPEAMANMRKMIVDRHPAFLSALNCYESQTEFTIGGEAYKRSKFPEFPENLKRWLDRKNIYFECTQNDFELAFSKDLRHTLEEGFRKIKPVYDFLCILDV